jgi:hypothetical protein
MSIHTRCDQSQVVLPIEIPVEIFFVRTLLLPVRPIAMICTSVQPAIGEQPPIYSLAHGTLCLSFSPKIMLFENS